MGLRPGLLLLLAWAGPALAAPALIEDSIAQRVQACTVCHGKEGQASPDGYRPRLAGKPAGYLFQQLLNFRDGRRHYGPMVRLVTPLNEPYLREIAAYYAGLDLPYPAAPASREAPAVLQRGRQLALMGDAGLKLPACASCHGDSLTGVLPATPGLLGLPRDYVSAQLGAWISGQRRAHAPDCMADIARRLPAGDVTAVSAWLASQDVPVQAGPAERKGTAPPLRCGSATEAAP